MKRLCLFFLLMVSTSLSAEEGGITYGDGKTFNGPHGEFYYEAQGEGTPVVIINGGPGAGHTVFLGWFEFLLRDGFQLVYFDETGRGRATRKIDQPIAPQMGVDDLEALRKELKADKMIILAHSYGGIQGLQYAIQFPQHVEKLVMVNASYDAESHAMNIEHVKYVTETKYPKRWQKLMELRKQGIKSSDEKYDGLLAVNPDMYWYDTDKRRYMRKIRTGNKQDRFNYQTYLDIIGDDPEWGINGTLSGLEVEHDLKGFSVPTLVIGGRYDQISSPRVVNRFFQMLPETVRSWHMFEKSGHWPWVEQSKEFNKVLKEFITQ